MALAPEVGRGWWRSVCGLVVRLSGVPRDAGLRADRLGGVSQRVEVGAGGNGVLGVWPAAWLRAGRLYG